MIRWNLRKDGGWNRYKELAELHSVKMLRVIEDDTKHIEEVMTRFEKINNDIKFEAFGKVTIKDKRDVKNSKSNDSSQEVQAKCLLKKQTEKAEEELKKLKDANKGRVANVFKLVKAIQGTKKGERMEAHAILDLATGQVAVSAKEIKRISLEYCKGGLKNNEVEEGFENDVRLKEVAHQNRMDDMLAGGFTPTRGTFNKVIKKFKDNDKRNYDFLVKTGNKFKDAVFKLARRMLIEEVFPGCFEMTTLHQIYKGKGKKEIMSNNRFIHSKEWLPRLVEVMVVEVMKKRS